MHIQSGCDIAGQLILKMQLLAQCQKDWAFLCCSQAICRNFFKHPCHFSLLLCFADELWKRTAPRRNIVHDMVSFTSHCILHKGCFGIYIADDYCLTPRWYEPLLSIQWKYSYRHKTKTPSREFVCSLVAWSNKLRTNGMFSITILVKVWAIDYFAFNLGLQNWKVFL